MVSVDSVRVTTKTNFYYAPARPATTHRPQHVGETGI